MRVELRKQLHISSKTNNAKVCKVLPGGSGGIRLTATRPLQQTNELMENGSSQIKDGSIYRLAEILGRMVAA